MSQVERQGNDDNRQFSMPPPLSPSSTNDAFAHPSLAGNLIPRDYLSRRSDGQAMRPPEKPSPSPSPLHTNLQPQFYYRGASDSPLMSSSPSSANPSPFQNDSPTTQIAPAAFPTPPSNTGHGPSGFSEAMGKRPMGGSNQHDKNMTEGYFHTPPRKASDVTNASQPTTSSPMSNASSIQSLRESRPAQRIMPRTSSIDSAISSLSLAQTQKSFDANAVSAADIGNLVSAAGSAEAVIMHLLKEKHHAANQNSQLWRLVDKQRSLILGLNKDLERAMKEKDRYKKQAKELQSSVPPLPTADLQEIRPQTGERRDVSGTREKSKREDSSAGNIKGRGLNEGQGLSDFAPIGHTSLVQSRNHTENLVGSRRLSMSDPVSDERVSADHNLTFVGDKKDKIPHPNRKPPPAPLNLRHPEYTLTEQPDLYDSESDYEDISEVDGLSIERGRRKTREDDDREREAALEMSEEGRIGDREGNNISGNPNRHDGPAGLSSNLRQMTAQYLPAMERHEPAASILNPGMACAVSLNDRPLRSAPKSPGLPISPRPEDRPFGSALPRMPREAPNSLGPLRTPAGDNIAGLPVSPRVGRNQFQSHPNSPLVDNAVMRDNRAPSRGIYRGFMSEDYPHFLLPPNALPLIQVKVSSSRLRPSRNNYSTSRTSEEEPVFTLSIFSRSGNAELWRVEKVIAALPQLDQRIRQLSLFAGRLPDRSIFSGHSPVKVDARRAALNAYFEALLDTPMDERAASVICQFLSSDAIEPRDDETSLLRSGSQEKPEMLRGPDGRPTKEGYLTKRGKNFGGWKARYFVLHGPELKYFESPGGPHMGTIKLHHAQIGRQSEKMNPQSHSPSRVDDETENQYRHAFLILEPKRKDTSALVRHVLCAESDEERDAWVEALLEYVEGHLSENEGSNSLKGNSQTQEKQTTGTTPKSKLFSKGNSAKGINRVEMDTSETVQGFSYDDAVAAEPPVLGPSYESAKSPLDPAKGNSAIDQGEAASHPIISGPTNGAIIQDAGAWGNKAAAAAATITTKEKKRSIWGFRTRSSADLASQLQTSCDPPATPGSGSSPWADRKDIVRPVFGMPLGEAVQLCAPQGVDVDLPAVVYRSIEYLGTKGAASEEGIFRLSGSNVVVKSLKERFNTEGDVDLLADEQYYDVHAVASLFKQYLRELPTTVLTRELHLEFLRVLELDEREKKLVAFNCLVHRLPKPNLALLRALSQFLIVIVNNSDVNKMTVRNVGIVFAPTLNIPAPVFSMFLTDFDSIFGEPPESGAQTVEMASAGHSLSPQDIRSPRRQIFSDIPTPGYNQSSFRRQENLRDAMPEEELAARQATGLISMQPSYEQPYRPEGYNQSNFTSFNKMLAPDVDTGRSSKAKKRESSFLFMNDDHRNPSISPSSDN